MEAYLPALATAATLLIAGLWFKNFLPNYFNEKGKLLAQKEDLKAITKEVESVKTLFSKDIEYLKADLQRLLNLEINHRTEERNALISFYDKYNQWLYALLEVNYGAYNRSNLNDLYEKRIFIEKFYAETNVAQAKIQLLVKNDNIIVLSHDLMKTILAFKWWIDKRLLSLQHNIERHKSLTENFLAVIKDIDKNRDLANSLAQNEKTIEQERKELTDEFYKNRNSEYGKILPHTISFTSLVKAYLTE
ncbi:MAG: hypothetical protein JST90_03675 [Bacteroidetes bacterium]|nr:hypothetical protein [Bacteroidota bacterium]